MECWEHRWCGQLMYDRLVGAVETLMRRGTLAKVQNRHVLWDTHQIAVPGRNTKDGDNIKIPFDPEGALTPILERRKKLGPLAYVFGTETGAKVACWDTAWTGVRLLAYGVTPAKARDSEGQRQHQKRLNEIDLTWHDLRHEGACRLWQEGIDIRTIQLMLGHSTMEQTATYLNITDEELRGKMRAAFALRHPKGKRGLQAV
jgi:integrase